MEKQGAVPQAAALRYLPGQDDAPVILALGRGETAARIVERAGEYGIPVVEDAETAGILNRFGIGDCIPPELYGAIAKILAFISRMDEEFARKVGL